MRFVPDYFFCILSTFVRFLCPEENGSLFRAKSIFIQRVYSSLPAVRTTRSTFYAGGWPQPKTSPGGAGAGPEGSRDLDPRVSHVVVSRPLITRPHPRLVSFAVPLTVESFRVTYETPETHRRRSDDGRAALSLPGLRSLPHIETAMGVSPSRERTASRWNGVFGVAVPRIEFLASPRAFLRCDRPVPEFLKATLTLGHGPRNRTIKTPR